MRDFPAPWGIAGGWAISLFLDHAIRPHADVDVAVLRTHQRELWTALQPSTAEQAVAGAVRPWHASEWLVSPVHEVYLAWPDGYRLEFLLNESDDVASDWVYRRDARIRRALSRAFIRPRGTPCLAPEIVLLYKSKAPRPQDEQDFAAVLPHLDRDQRLWLQRAMKVTAPEHPWTAIVGQEA
jgi:hypothetical protein